MLVKVNMKYPDPSIFLLLTAIVVKSTFVTGFLTPPNFNPAISRRFQSKFSSTCTSSTSHLAFVLHPQHQKRRTTLSANLDDDDEEDDMEEEEFYLEEEDEEDEEYEEEEYEDEYETEEYEEEEDEGEVEEGDDDLFEYVPLQDDDSDPNYTQQKNSLEESIANREALKAIDAVVRPDDGNTDFMIDAVESFLNENVPDDDPLLQKRLKEFELSSSEIKQIEQMVEDGKLDTYQNSDEIVSELGTDSEVFPADDDPIMIDLDLRNEDLVNLQNSIKELVGTIQGIEDGSLIDNKQAIIDPEEVLATLDNETYYEVMACAEGAGEHEWAEAETIKADNPLGWLLYDLDYNVTNLLLAACKHNPQAPIILNHWMPQLVTYKRYEEIRQRNFQFTWDECDQANLDELERYYMNLGYDEIPTKSAKETGIIEFETDYDEDDIQMAAFENWMDEVYSEEEDSLYLDDEDFQPENNVFDPNFGLDDTEGTSRFVEEYGDFREEFEEEGDEYMDKIAKITNYTHEINEEAQSEFRGHLVVACSDTEADLDLAEKITTRMDNEFGKKVYVETRVYNQALPEDNVYEIWLESYDIELLHSRRKAIYNANQWEGPAELDDKQLDYIVGKVKYLISDDARYSFHLHEFVTEV